jgi:hypothetical protein
LRAKTHVLTVEETKAYIQQRLRIAGSDGQEIFDPEAMEAIHLYSSGTPRVINLICEHCLVSAFVDQQKVIGPAIVEAVARDFDLSDNASSAAMTPTPVPVAGGENPDLVEALRSLVKLADHIRQVEGKPSPAKGNYEPNS